MNKENVWMKTCERESEELHLKSSTAIKPKQNQNNNERKYVKRNSFLWKKRKMLSIPRRLYLNHQSTKHLREIE